jgi:hypothetical protein
MKLSIDLSPAQADRLRLEAERLGLTPEDLASAAIVDLLATTGDDFQAVGNHPFVDGGVRGTCMFEVKETLKAAGRRQSVWKVEIAMPKKMATLGFSVLDTTPSR